LENSIFEVKVKHGMSTDNWEEQNVVCDLSYYLKNYVCEYILNLAVQLKFTRVTLTAKDCPIG